jgi:hypothetical protein
MAGLVPAIHALRKQDVDAWHIGVRKHAVLWTSMAWHDGERVTGRR